MKGYKMGVKNDAKSEQRAEDWKEFKDAIARLVKLILKYPFYFACLLFVVLVLQIANSPSQFNAIVNIIANSSSNIVTFAIFCIILVFSGLALSRVGKNN